MNTTVDADFKITNSLGLHARPASLFVQSASGFQSEITVKRPDTGAEADGKSILSMLVLAVPCGSTIHIHASGPDAEEAVHALEDLIKRGFDEE